MTGLGDGVDDAAVGASVGASAVNILEEGRRRW